MNYHLNLPDMDTMPMEVNIAHVLLYGFQALKRSINTSYIPSTHLCILLHCVELLR
jgi:hypothetical protein